MNEHDMTEYAYKNGYKDGAKEFAERLLVQDEHSTMDNRIITADRVKRTLTELTERKEDEGK